MNIGIISSSKGGTFKAFHKITSKLGKDFNYLIISDRKCEILNYAKKNNLEYRLIKEKSNLQFSKKAKKELQNFGDIDLVILFYTRLITKDLFENFPVFNFHPSLLPAFKGFNPIKSAIKLGVKYFGTTLHLVTEEADSGQIVAQAVVAMPQSATVGQLNKISYFQKIYLMLLLVDLFENKAIKHKKGKITVDVESFKPTLSFNPSIKNLKYKSSFERLLKENKFSFNEK